MACTVQIVRCEDLTQVAESSFCTFAVNPFSVCTTFVALLWPADMRSNTSVFLFECLILFFPQYLYLKY